MTVRQRLRVTFAKGSPLKYISHLDLTLAWVRALRRAGLALAYSKGFNPQARLQLAAALPVGYTSSGEVMDVLLDQPVLVERFMAGLRPVSPWGLTVVTVEEVDLKSPSLQSSLRQADYRVTVETSLDAAALKARVAVFLAADHWEQQRIRRRRTETVDVRPLAKDVRLESAHNRQAVLLVRLSAGAKGNLRPDVMLAALGLAGAHAQIERMRLLFEFDNQWFPGYNECL